MSNFIVERKEAEVEIKFKVNLVASIVEELRDILKKLISDSINKLTLNFLGIEMIDSMGIGLLVSIHNALIERDAELEIINLSADLIELFSIMKLNDHLVIKGDE